MSPATTVAPAAAKPPVPQTLRVFEMAFKSAVCVGRRGEHKIQMTVASLRPDATTRWPEPPTDGLVPERGALFTSPAPPARCLTEACTILAPSPERTPLSKAASAVRSVLRSPQRT
ncbi:hypothetical protein AQI95_28710 [Streptomyces yokosukanensis]|uniref:Uncharacterized protein n=1 Tax=Streptomyces yokosukanensis TaxID=67386 RepID=A0A117Q0W3_9ACTN|nr:hypothetical protein [Streptomyces yokosukanensis]KUN02064.1 hypothetical protein AQI95_28710 [Streptomyces yokosukanensis]